MRRFLVAPLALFALLLSAPAAAQAPTTHLAQTTRFRSCVQGWAHACGMRDASGRTYGRAVPVQHCNTIELRPDGTVTASSLPGIVDSTGRYRIEGQRVRVEWLDERGRVRHTQDLTLSSDGQTLGDMPRID